MEATADPLVDAVVVYGLLNSMAVIIANTETLLARWDVLSRQPETATPMLDRTAAHARIVADALEDLVRSLPSTTGKTLDELASLSGSQGRTF